MLLDALLESSVATSGPLDFLFETWSYKVRGTDVFTRDNWREGMDLFRIGFGLVAAGLLLIEARARRLGARPSGKWVRGIAIGLTVVGFLTYFDFFNPNVRYNNYYHRHEFFHYYLGSKYSRELGYTRLYECAAIAEIEMGRGAQVKERELRDLRVNLIKPTKETYVFDDPSRCTSRFSPEKWAAFKKDVAWFESVSRGGYWENMQKDHGYNPPPVWTMTGKFFSSFGSASDGFFKALSTLDVLLHVGVLALLGWAFGFRVMAVASIFWGINAPANFYWTGGAFLRQDWIFFFVASVCLMRKRRFALAGGALTWSTLLRVFPLIAFAGAGIVVLVHWIKKRRLHPDHRRFIFGCLVAGAILIPTSMVVTGPRAYFEFISHIAVHKDTPLTNHMGLETMLSHDWDGRMRFTRNNALDDPFEVWKDARRGQFAELKPLFFAIVAFVFGWTVWALRRTKLLWIATALSLPLVISLTNLTCYYYCMFLIAVPLMRVHRGVGPLMLVVGAASMILLRSFYYIDDRYAALSYLFYALGLILLWNHSRPFSLARLKAWWHDEPEPRSKAREPASPGPAAPSPAE